MREHEPTELNRAKVVGLSCNGATQARIAQHLGITEKTLRLHYREQIDFGVESLLSNVLANMATIAIKGHGMPAVAAGKYLLSCRAGYREHSVLGVEPSGEGLSEFDGRLWRRLVERSRKDSGAHRSNQLGQCP